MKNQRASVVIVLAFAGVAMCQERGSDSRPDEGRGQGGPPAEVLDWGTLETPLLKGHVQLTSRDEFYKAGEAYFSADDRWVVFQAVPAPKEGERPGDFYSMYVAEVQRGADGRISGLGEAILISPPGSANTCGWFHPTEPWRVMFGSTIYPPATDQAAGFQVGTRRYTWLFPEETEIVETVVQAIYDSYHPDRDAQIHQEVRPIFTRPDYDAECSYSPCGRFILYAHVREGEKKGGRADADIWIFDTRTGEHHEIVSAPGYDGGPFFSPDGKRICYRSDRKLNDRLQLFVADLKFDGEGVPVGIEREYQITDNEHVNWAPYWHPSGRFIAYGSSEAGHWNYEVYAIEIDPAKLRADSPSSRAADTLRKVRLTHASGADILPVFTGDGRQMMWTAQRGPLAEGEQRASSQLWVAEFDVGLLKFE